ncbi:YceI family protein [Aggregatilinea lenta]|uniref:YceI family protein n=1 Tax=Aggregatilinea lenta TaxID=913108 RepID=UPI000E5AFEC2|nr:YceI family protein [Aggregatilinea lenta]
MTTAPTSRRRRPLKWILLSIVLIAVAALLLWIWQGSDVTPRSAVLATHTPQPEARRYEVDIDESALNVIVDTRIGQVHGAFELTSGTIELVQETGGWRLYANFTLDGRSLDVGNGLVNTTIRRALELDQYPEGVYIARSDDLLPDPPTSATLSLAGEVELHGVVQTYTVPTDVDIDGDRITLSAQMPIDVAAFGVSVPSLLASDELQTDLQVVAYEDVAAPVVTATADAGE